MGKIIYWTIKDLCRTIVLTLLNKFDFNLILSGGTGLGKSTLGFKVAKGVSLEFKRMYNMREETILYYYNYLKNIQGITLEQFMKKIMDFKEKKAYIFVPKRHLLYTKKEVLVFLNSWNGIGIADEMINVTFGRDFFMEDQKNIVKLINMNRDHSNLLISCVPRFQTLDNQIKNLTKMHIFVVRRGIGVINTPNYTMTIRDVWDTQTNEKIERQWLQGYSKKNPPFNKLTTFRGIIKFKKMRDKEEEKYQSIKNEKRNIVAQEEMQIDSDKNKDPFDELYERVVSKRVKNENVLEGFAIANKLDFNYLKEKIRKKLKKDGYKPDLKKYYWEKDDSDFKPEEYSIINEM